MTAIGPKECPKANVLNAMPKSVQPKAKAHLKDIRMAETKAEANTASEAPLTTTPSSSTFFDCTGYRP